MVYRFLSLILKLFFLPLSKTINSYLKYRKIVVIFRFGEAIGEHICMTSVIKAYKGDVKFIVLSIYPIFFKNNKKVIKTINLKDYSYLIKKIIKLITILSIGSNVHRFSFNSNFIFKKNKKVPNRPLHEIQSDDFLKKLNLKKLVPEINAKDIADIKFNLPKRYIVYNPFSKKTFTECKKISKSEIIKINNLLPKSTVLVSEKRKNTPLKFINLTGKTNLEELIGVIKNADMVITTEGMINHLSAALNVKTIVLRTGWGHPKISENKNIINMFSHNKFNCAPCFEVKCKYNKLKCNSNYDLDKLSATIKISHRN